MRIYNHMVELIIEQPSILAKSKGSFDQKKQLSEGRVPVEAVTTKAARLPKSKKVFSNSKGLRGTNENTGIMAGIPDH
jgi:hypothetical protein